jgi:hypothetical protein
MDFGKINPPHHDAAPALLSDAGGKEIQPVTTNTGTQIYCKDQGKYLHSRNDPI